MNHLLSVQYSLKEYEMNNNCCILQYDNLLNNFNELSNFIIETCKNYSQFWYIECMDFSLKELKIYDFIYEFCKKLLNKNKNNLMEILSIVKEKKKVI